MKIFLLMCKRWDNQEYEDAYGESDIVSVHQTKDGALAKMFSNKILDEGEVDLQGDMDAFQESHMIPQELEDPEKRYTVRVRVLSEDDFYKVFSEYYIVEQELEP